MKKATMKDIARAANVSVATVSYVLNNVKNQTIPDQTRENVLQAAKDLCYVPNLAARSLVKRKSGLVGILINRTEDMPYWKRHRYSAFIDGLEARLTQAGYHALLVSLNPNDPYLEVIRERKLDAVFLVDVKDEMFYRISANFTEGIPLILVDSLVEDQLFNMVTYNFPAALQAASSLSAKPVCLITDSYYNQALMNWITASAELTPDQLLIVSEPDDISVSLPAFLQRHNSRQVIVINEFLALQVEKIYNGPITVICTCGTPEILSRRSKMITFKDSSSQMAFELMNALFNEEESNKSNKSIGNNKFLVEVST